MYQVFPTLNNKFPCEGPKAVPVTCDFTIASIFTVDLKAMVQQGKISEIQSLFVDNSENDKPLVISVAVQNQTLIVPPYSQAYLAILASVAQLNVSSSNSMAVVNVFALNFPVANCVWTANAAGVAQSVNVANFPNVQPVFINTGSSFAFSPSTTGANLAVTTASASVSIAPLTGQNIRLFNNGSENVYVRLSAGASTATTSDLTIAPNESIILNASNMTVLSAICATTGTSLNYVIGSGGM